MHYRPVLAVGLAFLSIQAAWTTYNTYVPELLRTRFGMSASFVFYFLLFDRVVTIVIEPLMGAMSDRAKRRLGTALPYVMLGIALTGLLFALMPLPARLIPANQTFTLAETLTHPFLLFAVASLFTMAFIRVPSVRMMPDITAPALRDRANGILQSMASVGSQFAAYIGAWLVEIDIGAPFWAAVAVMAVAGIVLRFAAPPPVAERDEDDVMDMMTEEIEIEEDGLELEVVDEGAPAVEGVDTTERSGGLSAEFVEGVASDFVAHIIAMLRNRNADKDGPTETARLVATERAPSLIWSLVAITLAFLGLALVIASFPAYARQRLELEDGVIRALLTGFTIAFTVLVLFAWRVSARIGRQRAMIGGLVGMAASLAATRLGGGPVMIGALLLLGALGWSLFLAHALPMLLSLGARRATGLIVGLYFGAFVLSSVVGQYLNPFLTTLAAGNAEWRFLAAPLVLLLAAACLLAGRSTEADPRAAASSAG